MLLQAMYIPKGPCTHIVHTLAPKYLYSDYFKEKVIYYLGTWTLRALRVLRRDLSGFGSFQGSLSFGVLGSFVLASRSKRQIGPLQPLKDIKS